MRFQSCYFGFLWQLFIFVCEGLGNWGEIENEGEFLSSTKEHELSLRELNRPVSESTVHIWISDGEQIPLGFLKLFEIYGCS